MYYIVYYADLTSAIVNTMKTAPCYYSSQVSKENGLVVFYIKGKK